MHTSAYLVVDLRLLLELHLDLVQVREAVLNLELTVRLRLSRRAVGCHGHGAAREWEVLLARPAAVRRGLLLLLLLLLLLTLQRAAVLLLLVVVRVVAVTPPPVTPPSPLQRASHCRHRRPAVCYRLRLCYGCRRCDRRELAMVRSDSAAPCTIGDQDKSSQVTFDRLPFGCLLFMYIAGGRARGRMLQLARSWNKVGSAHDGVDCGCGESGNNGSRRGSPWGSPRNRIRLRSTDSSATGTLVRTNWLENTRLIRARLADPRSRYTT